MAIITPKTFVAGNPITAADMNTYVSGILGSLITKPSCRAYVPADATVPTTTLTTMQLTAEQWDNSAMHSNVSNPSRIVAPIAGVYLIEWYLRWKNVTVTACVYTTQVKVNGVAVQETGQYVSASNVYPESGGMMHWKLNANDYVELAAYQNSAANQTVDSLMPCALAATWVSL